MQEVRELVCPHCMVSLQRKGPCCGRASGSPRKNIYICKKCKRRFNYISKKLNWRG